MNVSIFRNITQDELERVKEIAVLLQLVQPGLFSDSIFILNAFLLLASYINRM